MANQSSLFVVSDGNTQTAKVLEPRKGNHGGRSFGVFPSS